jgi:DNA ligase D-like protein (predicted 3'-phosphoesterase)
MNDFLYSMMGIIKPNPKDSMVRSLSVYRKKRDFKKTKEPAGKKKAGIKRPTAWGVAQRGPIFVIQQHAARAMHYDFRLQIAGVLVSWAVPKGPSLNPKTKRLAVMTEDHPIEYAKFEGIIPRGEYGAGPVIVWDRGTYKNLREKDGTLVSMESCVQEGRIEIFLHGKKLKGAFALIRMKGATGTKSLKSNWLLIKMRDDHADARRNPVSSEPESVKTGKTIEDWKEKMKAMEKRKNEQ